MLISSKKNQRSRTNSPILKEGHKNTQQLPYKIQKTVNTNRNLSLVELVEPDEHRVDKTIPGSIKIPLFKGITKSKNKKITQIRENSRIQDNPLPLFLETDEKNYTSHFMNVLKMSLLSQLSASSTMEIPSYFKPICEFIDERLDSVSNFNELQEIILLKSAYDYSSELFERYLIDSSKRKKDCEFIKISLPFIQGDYSINEINEELCYRYHDEKFKPQIAATSSKKIDLNHTQNSSRIKQSILDLIDNVHKRNIYNNQTNGILFTFNDIRGKQVDTADTYLKVIYDILPYYELPIIIIYNQQVTDELQHLPRRLSHPLTTEVQTFESFSKFAEQTIALLSADPGLTNVKYHSIEWNTKIKDYMYDLKSCLHNEMEKLYFAGKGPLNSITMILNMINECKSLKSALHVLGKRVK
ncbi:hypothetical protein C6P45_004162 [Maudiozyma exigua]|uniref:Uncharacterized protein n=1 Tax=Maudiozyma exigua TaxID=34358 RepID=A0A9P7BA23_MAUEX|nr:hypothetical protein C6P45_004162 [Kazachstania exigua]